VKIFDTNHDVTHKLPKLVGYDTIIRYISTNFTSEKCIKSAEARAIADAGKRLGLVFEVYGGVDDFKHHDINELTGQSHGRFALAWALGTCGAPKEAVIYFAIDTDASDLQVKNLVVPYFQAINDTIHGRMGVGVYACGAACAALLDQNLASKAWLSNAMGWNGSKEFRASGRESILQRLPANIEGLDTDPDDKVHEGEDIGDFVPFAYENEPKEHTDG
jgi:hypothetical protein